MLLITLGGVVVSITAWGYSLKGSIDLNKQATEQLVQAQREANENVKALAINQSATEKDVIGLQKDVDALQKKTLSYNTGSRTYPVETTRIEQRNEVISPAPEKKSAESNSKPGFGERLQGLIDTNFP